MTTTIKTSAAYLATLAIVLFWWLLLQIGCRCDAKLAASVKAGEPIDHLDPALARLDRLHVELFGEEE